MANRLAQVSGHLSNAHGRGLLSGEVAIITGGGQGIGRSAALLFAKEGARVVVSDIDANKAAAVVDEIKAAGGDAISVAGDVGADDFPQKIVDATVKQYGKINHIVNNAGFTHDKMIHTMPDETYDIIMKIHVRAPFRLIRAAAPYFRVKSNPAENRSIVNVSSTSGLHGNVGQANYAAAKSAVVGLTKTIAKEWGPFGVRANTIAYGLVHTRLTAAKEDGATIEIDGQKVALGIPGAKQRAAAQNVNAFVDIPLQRGATPDEAAAGMLFLASPLASYVTGHTLEVTGGRGI
ncbi:NAD(P)-binding protein [Suillus subaureus]|uniref:NAD(P)-binding protein n=1 Tax=Suillus subaureus TaxID=48587 RepID=A0A9P7JCD1_9AGAM|nr:NAD(P)-binding protein [Suillus subaureus]KAG1814309.1 NAD(P)-binding protein [Suillus subaureus]